MSKKSTRAVASAAFCLLSCGCGTAYPGSPQTCAGINDVKVSYDARTGSVEAAMCGGKEYDSVTLSGKTSQGLEFLYEAEGAKAFGGQMAQAELNAALNFQTQAFVRELIRAVNPAAGDVP